MPADSLLNLRATPAGPARLLPSPDSHRGRTPEPEAPCVAQGLFSIRICFRITTMLLLFLSPLHSHSHQPLSANPGLSYRAERMGRGDHDQFTILGLPYPPPFPRPQAWGLDW